MDVKPSSVYAPVVIPEAYRRPVQPLQRISQSTSAISPEDIIDCVEVQANGYQAANNSNTAYERSPDKPLIAKGKLVDIWI